MIEVISDILKFIVLLTDIATILLIIILIINKLAKAKLKFTNTIIAFARTYATQLALAVALTATLGSLYYSEILNYTPCELCWYQRIFMYPLVLLFALARWKKKQDIPLYALPLAILGAVVAAWHYSMQKFWIPVTCSVNEAASCATKYTFAYGYITISMMALTGFIAIIILMILKLKEK